MQRVLPIGQTGKVERPRPRGRVPCRSGQGGRRARWARARGASMPQHGQHVIFDGGAEHWKRGVGHAGHGVLRHPTVTGVGVGVVHGPDVVNDELVAVHPRRQGHVHGPLVGGGFDERCAGRPSVPLAVDADVARVAAPFEDVGCARWRTAVEASASTLCSIGEAEANAKISSTSTGTAERFIPRHLRTGCWPC